LEGVVEGYDRYKFRGQHDHTLQHILAVVDRIIGTEPQRRETAFRTIGGFILLDALILNTDRHHENWAMLRQTVDGGQAHHWIAPSFDHASSLGRELTEKRLKEWAHEPWRVEWYAKRARGGVYLKTEGRHGENPLHLAEVAHRRWGEYLTPWIRCLQRVGYEPSLRVVDRLPVGCIGERSREFTKKLLTYTHGRLRELK